MKRTLNDYTMRELLDMWKRDCTFVQFCKELEEKLEEEHERAEVQGG